MCASNFMDQTLFIEPLLKGRASIFVFKNWKSTEKQPALLTITHLWAKHFSWKKIAWMLPQNWVCHLKVFFFDQTHPTGINDSSCEVVVIFSVVTTATVTAGKFIFSSPISSIFWFCCSSKSSEVEVKVLVVLWGTNLSSSAFSFFESISWLIEVVVLPIRLLLDVCNDESVLIVVGGLVSKTDLSYRQKWK